MPYSSKPCARLLVGVSASVHCVHLPSYLLEFKQSFCDELRVIMTPSAAEMIEPRILGLYCDEPVSTSIWGSGGGSVAPHVRLPRWADLFVVLPATANTLSKAATGIADNLLTTAILASEPGVIFAPAMNPVMYDRPAVQRTLTQLEDDGHYVCRPEPLTSVTTGAFDAGFGPTVETLLSHMWHVFMRRQKEAGWEAAVAQPPQHPSGDVAMPVPVIRRAEPSVNIR